MSKTDAEIQHFIEDILTIIFSCLKYVFCTLFQGFKKLNSKKTLIPLFLCMALSATSWFLRSSIASLPYEENIKMILCIGLLLLPIFYLFILGLGGGSKPSKYDAIFMALDFKGRDKKFPAFCGCTKTGKKELLTFKSNIPLSDWKKNRELLETGLDRNILRIENGNSKNIIKLITVPASCVIPTFIYWNDVLLSQKDGEIVLGISALSKVSFNLNRTPHALFAGETGSGKSVLLRNCLWQLINQSARVFMFDFKGGVEFGKQYEQYGEVITKRERALEVLDLLVEENQERLELFRELRVKNLPEYNHKTGRNLCRIGVFCDEIAEMLDKKGASKTDKALLEKLEGRISTLARLSRATGINLFFGVQRPDANVLTGQIKNNIPIRISGRFADKSASEIVLGTTEATELPDIKGRFLFKLGNEITEFQSFFFQDEYLKNIPYDVGSMLSKSAGSGHSSNVVSCCSPVTARPATKHSRTSDSIVPHQPAIPDLNMEAGDWAQQLNEMDQYDLNLDFSK